MLFGYLTDLTQEKVARTVIFIRLFCLPLKFRFGSLSLFRWWDPSKFISLLPRSIVSLSRNIFTSDSDDVWRYNRSCTCLWRHRLYCISSSWLFVSFKHRHRRLQRSILGRNTSVRFTVLSVLQTLFTNSLLQVWVLPQVTFCFPLYSEVFVLPTPRFLAVRLSPSSLNVIGRLDDYFTQFHYICIIFGENSCKAKFVFLPRFVSLPTNLSQCLGRDCFFYAYMGAAAGTCFRCNSLPLTPACGICIVLALILFARRQKIFLLKKRKPAEY